MKRYNLKNFRQKHDLTQGEMASKLGISKSYYVAIELGHVNPSFKVAEKIGEVFAGEYDDIFELLKKGA